MLSLSTRQHEALRLIIEITRATGYPPSRAELAKRMNLRTTQAVNIHINALVRKGHLLSPEGKARSLRPTDTDNRPLVDLSKTTHDAALLCTERIVDRIPGRFVDQYDPRPDFFANPDTQSRRRLGLRPGDLLAVRSVSRSQKGQLSILHRDGAWTCARVQRDENAPHIGGIVIGVLRSMPVNEITG